MAGAWAHVSDAMRSVPANNAMRRVMFIILSAVSPGHFFQTPFFWNAGLTIPMIPPRLTTNPMRTLHTPPPTAQPPPAIGRNPICPHSYLLIELRPSQGPRGISPSAQIE